MNTTEIHGSISTWSRTFDSSTTNIVDVERTNTNTHTNSLQLGLADHLSTILIFARTVERADRRTRRR